jgi:hypothetical protein
MGVQPVRNKVELIPHWCNGCVDEVCTGGAGFQYRLQILFDRGVGQDFFFRPAPGRRTCPAAGSWGSASSSASPRSMVRREHFRTLAMYFYFTPP